MEMEMEIEPRLKPREEEEEDEEEDCTLTLIRPLVKVQSPVLRSLLRFFASLLLRLFYLNGNYETKRLRIDQPQQTVGGNTVHVVPGLDSITTNQSRILLLLSPLDNADNAENCGNDVCCHIPARANPHSSTS
jgi:hypothetical protein